MAEEGSPISILLADGHSLFREAVKAVLESEADLVVIAEAGDGRSAVQEVERHRPDVALVAINLPNCDGLRATNLMKERVPDCGVLVLAAEEDEKTLAAAVEAGANGYLTKECPLAELIDATRRVHSGETLIPSRMLGALLGRLIRRRRSQSEALERLQLLTRREREVLAYLADGADNDSIAQALVISPQTARTHIQNILSKLKVHSRLEATAFVIQNGVLDEIAGARQ